MKKPQLDFLFHPESIAIIGVSTNVEEPNAGQRFLRSLIKFGYKGNIYPVHPAGGELMGIKVYPNIKDVPGDVDYVISAVQARHTPQLIEDCAAKKVKVIHLFTSGYGEIEDEIGKHLEQEVLSKARKNNIRLIGPNCMGIYCPASGLTFAFDYPHQRALSADAGSFALVSQSGGNAIFCARDATSRGINFSKLISYGNAADLSECDFLEYLVEDDDTEIIGIYIEGIKDGPRFRRTLERAATSKPVIVYKGGNSETGVRACASHTSAMAGSNHTWQSLLKQVGAISVNSMDEIVDMALAFLKEPFPCGRNMVAIGTGGGVGVQTADSLSRENINLPILPKDIRAQLRELYGTEAGSSFRNPIDAPWSASAETHFKGVRIISDCDDIDGVIMHFPFDIWSIADRNEAISSFIEATIEAKQRINKPLIAVLYYCVTPDAKNLAFMAAERLVKAGVAVYPSMKRAARAINRYILYGEQHKAG